MSGFSWLPLTGFLVITAAAWSGEPSVVKIERQGEGWRLVRNGQPFFIKGACAYAQLDGLGVAGANAIRSGSNEKTLDQAQRLGLSVLVGLPLGKPRSGFSYTNSTKLVEQRERIRQLVLKLKDHPAVLMWAIGNEPTIFTPPEQRVVLWQEVNRLAELVRSLDPNHPVTAVVGGEQWRNNLGELDEHCPALDAVGLNAYADMLGLPEDLKRQGWRRPYIITEFGPRGHWQVSKTAWGARLEDSSTEKAEFYRRAYEHAVLDRPQCLGSFAFLWGWKMEKTHTWYGMLMEDGNRTEAVDVMTHAWRGEWPTNRCPRLSAARIQVMTDSGQPPSESGVLRAGDKIRCLVDLSDPENDPLAIEWDLRRDVADDPRVGGDYEPLEPAIAGAVIEAKAGSAVIRLPQSPGKYRVFVYGRDGQGGAATANVPLLTK